MSLAPEIKIAEQPLSVLALGAGGNGRGSPVGKVRKPREKLRKMYGMMVKNT
jgi:hypothetical protein